MSQREPLDYELERLENSLKSPQSGLWPRTPLQLAGRLAAVLALLAIIALLLTGPVQRARSSRNGFAVLSEIRKLREAQSWFRESQRPGKTVYAYGSLTKLGEAGLIDAELASGVKGGYRFVVVPGTDGTANTEYLWWMAADPLVPGRTGDRYFFTNQGGCTYSSAEGPIRPRPNDAANRPSHGMHGGCR